MIDDDFYHRPNETNDNFFCPAQDCNLSPDREDNSDNDDYCDGFLMIQKVMMMMMLKMIVDSVGCDAVIFGVIPHRTNARERVDSVLAVNSDLC